MIKPKEIRRLGSNTLKISWFDGLECEIDARTLRLACPCADCQQKRGDTSHAQPLSPRLPNTRKSSLRVIEASTEQQTDLKEIWAIGNYALGTAWGDGHRTGIYTYDLLRTLSNRAL